VICSMIVLMKNGTIYATGLTESSHGIATPGAYQESYGGASDAMLVQFNLTGQRNGPPILAESREMKVGLRYR